MLNASIFSFIILNLLKKGILNFLVSTATDIRTKEVIDSYLRRPLMKIIGTLKALKLTIIALNLTSQGLTFYYTVILQTPRYRTGLYDIGNL